MHIFISGSHGFLGSALMAHLSANGHRVTRLTRGAVDAVRLEGAEAVIHLAGESIMGRWTSAKKAKIRDSRVEGTRALAEALARLSRPPQVMLCASATGIYGDRADEQLQETSAPGSGFLAEVCQAWEAAAQPAVQQGIRVAFLRTGMVLSPQGGALAKMLPAFRAGMGGRLGRGRQYMSWISLEDWLEAVSHILEASELRGPVNLVSPQPVTNRGFTKALGRALKRPTVFPVPAFVLRVLLGELAEELLLSSQRVVPAALLSSGFSFRDPDLEGALRRMLGGAHA